MISRKSAVHKAQQPVRFGQIVIAFSLTLMIADSSKRGAPVNLESTSAPPRPINWIKFDTNACGGLAGVESRRSMLMKSTRTGTHGERVDDGGGDEDNEGDSVAAWGMSQGASALAEEWILEHPQVAIVSDAIGKSCSGDDADDADSGTSGIA